MRTTSVSSRLIVALAVILTSVVATAVSAAAQGGAIAFVQGTYAVPQTPQSTVSVTFGAAQGAGNLNVIAIGWSDTTATVTNVSDSAGNAYAPAIAPTTLPGQITHVIYYAKNIRAGANTVTVTFSAAANYPDVRIVEYRGLDPVNPLHASVGATGSSATSSTGTLTTTAASVLLVAANDVSTSTRDAGPGFTSRMITGPDGNIVQDRIVTAAGSYSASAPLNSSGNWAMQLVAFSATPSGPDATPPTVAITSPAAGGSTFTTRTTPLTLSGTAGDNLGVTQVAWTSSQGTSGNATTTNAWATWSAAGIALQPGSNLLTVTATDAASNTKTATLTVTYDPTAPTVSLTAPAAGAALTGTTTLTASAADNISVIGVQFLLDGAALGAEVTGAGPSYSLSWNTAGASNGAHSLAARARDAAGNTTTSSAVAVSVSNATVAPSWAFISGIA